MIDRSQIAKDEAKYKWLPILLDAYDISDRLTAECLAELSKEGLHVACQKGCYACCLNPAVPLNELEMMGISWYVEEKLQDDRLEVMQRLSDRSRRSECAFLIGGCCSIYPMRPLSCRLFYVKSPPCAVGEGVHRTRAQDIVMPTKRIAKEVSMRILDYFGIKGDEAKEKAFEEGVMVEKSMPMNQHDWSTIGQAKMSFREKIMRLFTNESAASRRSR
jgi:hypothetical protein